MKHIMFSFIFLTLVACAQSSIREPSASTDAVKVTAPIGRHYIMTIHGVHNMQGAFEAFHQIIKPQLEKVDPGYIVIPIEFTFQTGTQHYNPHNIVQSINNKISGAIKAQTDSKNFPNGVLGVNDRISILAYSMGGQVGMTWYYDTMLNDKYKDYRFYLKHFDTFMGLGGAYFGTGTGEYLTKSIPDVVINNAYKTKQISGAEIDSLLPMSNITYEIHQNRIRHANSPELSALYKPRFVHIAGVIPCFDQKIDGQVGCGDFASSWASKINLHITSAHFGYKRWESDGMIPVPHARTDFIYATDLSTDYAANTVTPETSFKSLFNLDYEKLFIPVETLHASVAQIVIKLFSPVKGTNDVAMIPESCADPKNCKHPNYKYEYYALANCNRDKSTCDMDAYNQYFQDFFGVKDLAGAAAQVRQVQDDLRGFVVELNLRVPKNYQLAKVSDRDFLKYVSVPYVDYQNMDELALSNLKISKVLFVRQSEDGAFDMSIVRSPDPKSPDEDHVRMIFFGLAVEKDKNMGMTKELHDELFKNVVIPMTIHLPGLKTRVVHVPIKPTISTYVDLRMAPK